MSAPYKPFTAADIQALTHEAAQEFDSPEEAAPLMVDAVLALGGVEATDPPAPPESEAHESPQEGAGQAQTPEPELHRMNCRPCARWPILAACIRRMMKRAR